MKKAPRILLSIFIPLILNVLFILYTNARFGPCEYRVNHYECILSNTYFYIGWIIVQLAAMIIILIKSKNRKQILAFPIISILFILLFVKWSTGVINYQPREFNPKDWNNKNHFFRSNSIEYLIKNEPLKEKCYEGIIEMLGKPDKEDSATLEYDFGFGILIIKLNNGCYESIDSRCEG